MAVGELLDNRAALQLFNYLRIAGVVVGVDEMFAVMPFEAPSHITTLSPKEIPDDKSDLGQDYYEDAEKKQITHCGRGSD